MICKNIYLLVKCLMPQSRRS